MSRSSMRHQHIRLRRRVHCDLMCHWPESVRSLRIEKLLHQRSAGLTVMSQEVPTHACTGA
eukprot:10519761-Alexandrium_andersonii.AAC.1